MGRDRNLPAIGSLQTFDGQGWRPVASFLDPTDISKTLRHDMSGQAAATEITLSTGAQTAPRRVSLPTLLSDAILAASASALTSGRVPIATTNGLLLDTSKVVWDEGNIQFRSGEQAEFGLFFSCQGQLHARRETGNATIRATTVSNANGSFIVCDRFRGTFAAPTAVQSADQLGSFLCLSYDGTAVYHGSELRMVAAENWAVGAHGTKTEWYEVKLGQSAQSLVATMSGTGLAITDQLSASKLLGGTTSLDADVTNAFGTPTLSMVSAATSVDTAVIGGYGNNAVGPHLYGFKTRSASATCDANTTVQNGDELFSFAAFGASPNGDYRSAAIIKCVVDGVPSGTIVPGRLDFYTRDTAGNFAVNFAVYGTGSVVCNSAAISTSATDGFLYVPTCAGTPSGAPTAYTGRAPIVVNTTNNKLYFYSGGAWRDAGP